MHAYDDVLRDDMASCLDFHRSWDMHAQYDDHAYTHRIACVRAWRDTVIPIVQYGKKNIPEANTYAWRHIWKVEGWLVPS
jgi:hypothetical protein